MLENGIAHVATPNHAVSAPFHACSAPSATSCHDCADAIVPMPVPSCSAPPVTIHGAEANIDPTPHKTLAPCHTRLCLESTYD